MNDTTDIGGKYVLLEENSHPPSSEAEGCLSRDCPRRSETVAQCDKRLKQDRERKRIKCQHESAIERETI
jgi:hypothetical protein